MAHSQTIITGELRVQKDFERTNIAVVTEGVIAQLSQIAIQHTFRQRIITSQREDPNL